MSQSRLARLVGIDQSTIASLEAGKSRSSAHLHKIARELRTTPAYLTGETDDPESGAPALPALSRDDVELLEKFALLSDRARAALMTMIDELTPDRPASVHGKRHTYRANSQGG